MVETTSETRSRSELGERLREARHARGWSQVQLAHHAGISQQTITALERGATQRTRFLPQLAEALSVDAEWLAGGRGRGPDTRTGEMGIPLREAPVLRAAEALLVPIPAGGHGTIGLAGEELEKYGQAFGIEIGVDGRDLVGRDSPFQPGDTLLLDPACTQRPGDYCLVSIRHQEPAFGRLRLQEDSTWALVPENEMFPVRVLSEDDRIIGVIREIRRPIR